MNGRFGFLSFACAVLGVVRFAIGMNLTGAVISAPHETGSDWEVMDTTGGSAAWNLWVSYQGAFINGPLDADAGIDVALSPGTYTFETFGQPTLLRPTWRINLFFDGNSVTPSISAYADMDTSATDDPPFLVNTSLDSIGLHDVVVTPASSLTYNSAGITVILSDFVWSSPAIYATDAVGTYNRPPSDGDDFMGHFTLTVIPEPGTMAIMGMAVAVALPIRRRRMR